MPYIRVKTGPNAGKIYEVRDSAVTIGRENDQSIQILDEGVSRKHAEIFRLGDLCFIRDHGSTNGSYVNHVRVTEEVLKAGDEVMIGTTVLVFEESHPDTAPQVLATKSRTTALEIKVDEAVASGGGFLGQEAQLRNLKVLDQMSGVLLGERDSSRAYERVLELLAGALRADHGCLFLPDRASGQFVPNAFVETEAADGERKVSRAILKRVQEKAMPLLTTDATLDGRFALSESIILRKIKSVICVPVMQERRMEGLLYFHCQKVGRSMTVEDLVLVSAAAIQLSIAMAAAAGERRRNFSGSARALMAAMEIADPKVLAHSQRVSDNAAAMAVQMGLSSAEVHDIQQAGLLHDVGKLAVHQTAREVPEDRMERQHVLAGERILTGVPGLERLLPGVKYHHERADGTGFPYRLKNEGIPVMARIIIVANAFDDACLADGPGGRPLDAGAAIEELARRGGREFDADVVQALVACHLNGSLYGMSPSP